MDDGAATTLYLCGCRVLIKVLSACARLVCASHFGRCCTRNAAGDLRMFCENRRGGHATPAAQQSQCSVAVCASDVRDLIKCRVCLSRASLLACFLAFASFGLYYTAVEHWFRALIREETERRNSSALKVPGLRIICSISGAPVKYICVNVRCLFASCCASDHEIKANMQTSPHNHHRKGGCGAECDVS